MLINATIFGYSLHSVTVQSVQYSSYRDVLTLGERLHPAILNADQHKQYLKHFGRALFLMINITTFTINYQYMGEYLAQK